MSSEKYISIVIPNYNGSDTIGKCLEAIFSSRYQNFEVIVVDDGSRDNSVEIIKKFSCKLIELNEHRGTSNARNTGALSSRGDFIFFTDADCILNNDTLSLINSTLSTAGPDTVIGGTYTSTPYDSGFFNFFQSVFVNYSETKITEEPDYIAAHAMVIDAMTFRKSGGFPEKFLPILEDVEFSHRLRKAGCRFVINPQIQVRHIFNFTILRSILNAIRKSKYWTIYNLKSSYLFVDSGSSSTELKTNVISASLVLSLLCLSLITGKHSILYLIPPILLLNILINRQLLKAFYNSGGISFSISAAIYYTTIYAASVGTGALAGMAKYFFSHRLTQTKNPKDD